MKYSVYDIIYRNDSNIRRLLENDLLFTETGFVAFRDVHGRFWYFYKKAGLLVPGQQEYIDRTYGTRDLLPRLKKIRIGEDECDCSLPPEEYAKDFFVGLSRISACADWRIERQLWKVSGTSSSVLYDAPIRMVRPEQFLDRVSTLRCAFTKERDTNRRNFTNFDEWEYIDSYEMTPDGKLALPQPAPVQEPESAAPGEGARPEAALSREAASADALQSGQKAEGTVPQERETATVEALQSGQEAEGTVPQERETASVEALQSGQEAEGTVPQEQETATIEALHSNQGTEGTAPREQETASVEALQSGQEAEGTIPQEHETASVEASVEALQSNQEAEGTVLQEQGTAISESGQSGQETEGAFTREDMSGEAPCQEVEAGMLSQQERMAETALPQEASSGNGSSYRKKHFTNIETLLDCDKLRCRMESYEEAMLYDIKRGHWDVYECGETVDIPDRGKLVPRDPRKDIKTGVVGIDFGTKSTVVVRQDDTSAIIPIRIGAGELSAELRENDYENPTIIECTDLDEFIKKYYEQAGRPETSCEDFFVSYDAYRDYHSCPPSEFYAYYADLKQWANHEKENVVVWDKKKHEYHFGVNGSKDNKIINPIELYAYYIGMYINNMRNGIYLKYLMSFPVGYSRETRQLIVSSFEKGIRKSLPTCILEDEECMKEFSVRLGISEPAAYAVTALEMSELEPQNENDQYRYGIFDFGGGTADFGFGIWRGASEREYEVEGYDYVLECFGADSDVTLGGEKILELLAYAVFKKNRGVARRRKLTCSLPVGAQAFLGSETLISNSQIAQRNMSILKEELRPLWHQEENWEKKYRHESAGNGIGAGCIEYEEYIEPSLYDIDGNRLSDCRFAVDTKGLISLIKARIQKGIDAFFKCMSKAFQREGRLADYDGQMYIFLAGNSSRSIFVKELFEENIRNYSSKQEGACFKLVEPLNEENGDEYVPNGKTSVAYGLIKSREGSSIKVEKSFETDAEKQTRFRYYLGRERRHHFDCRLSPVETEYGTWIRFQGAARGTVRIYYTTNPIADVREEPPAIDNIPYKEITIDPQPEEFIFIRACEPEAIEYAVAGSVEAIDGEGGIHRVAF